MVRLPALPEQSPSTPGAVERAPRRHWGTLAILPAVLVMLAFGLYPVFSLLWHSFGLGEIGIYEDTGPTLSYYVNALSSKFLLTSIRNSIFVGLGAVLITITIAIPTVIHLADRQREGQSTAWIDAIMTFPITLPGIIIGFFSIVLIGRNGLIPQWLPSTSGLAFGFGGLFIAYIFFSIPRIIGPLRGAAEILEPEMKDVAQSLGASNVRTFWTITFPLILPAAIEVSGTAAAVALGGYGTVAALSEGIRLLPLDVVDALNNGFNLATSSALAVILALLAVGALLLGKILAVLTEKAFH